MDLAYVPQQGAPLVAILQQWLRPCASTHLKACLTKQLTTYDISGMAIKCATGIETEIDTTTTGGGVIDVMMGIEGKAAPGPATLTSVRLAEAQRVDLRREALTPLVRDGLSATR